MTNQEKQFLERLYRFGRRRLLFILTGRLAYFLLVVMLMWLSVVLADRVFYFSETTRWGLWFINLGILGWMAFHFLWKPLRSFIRFTSTSDLSETARIAGRMYPEVEDRMVDAYHLVMMRDSGQSSRELKDLAVQSYLRQFGERLQHNDLRFIHFTPPRRIWLPVLMAIILLVTLAPDGIYRSTLRMLNPANAYLEILPFHFKIEPGQASVVRGESLDFRVSYEGPRLTSCFLVVDSDDQDSQQNLELKKKNNIYTAQVKNVQKPFTYRIKGQPLRNPELEDQIWSDRYKINVLIPPEIRTLDVKLTPPAYSALPVRHLDRNVGDMAALAGTQAELLLQVDKILDSAYVLFNSGDSLRLNIRGNQLSGTFMINENDSYRISLRDTSGLRNRNPISYQIGLMPDNAPYVEIPQPGADVESPLDALLRLQIEANDDFGFSGVQLIYKYVRQARNAADTSWQAENLRLSGGDDRHQQLSYTWDFSRMPLAFEDGIRYYALARDNNNITGPGVGRSKIYSIRFPSLEEVFDSFAEKQQEESESLEEVARQAKEMKKNLQDIQREMKRENKLDWERKEQLNKTLEKQRDMQDKVEEIRKNLDELIQKMESSELISPQVLEKYMQLQELFQQVATPELLEAMNKLQQAIDQNKPREVQNALQEFKLQQEAFERNIDRTMELLKQVQFEQRMDELVQKAQKLLEQQQKISRQLDENKKDDAVDFDQAGQQQEQQEENLNRLEKDLQSFMQDPMTEQFPETVRSLDSAYQSIEQSAMKQDMQRMLQNLQNRNQQAASESSRQIEQKMEQMHNALRQSQEQMMQKSKRDIMDKMASATRGLLQLSEMQEQVMKQTENTSPLNESFSDVMKEQGRTLENYQKVISDIIQLSRETFFVNKEMSQAMAKAQQSMGRSLNELSERNQGAAAKQQQQAMAGLNESVMKMRQSMSQLAQSQSGTGFEQFMEQMQQMSGQQGQVNEQTLGMFQNQGNGGKLSVQQQQSMQRLAAQQAALQEAMKEMAGQYDQQGELSGRLGQMAEEMEEVARDLLAQNVDRETIERQRRILSRMLDAQKSLKEREYSKKRKAEQARNYVVKDPGTLGETERADKKYIRDALRRALNEGYSRDYQRLIEAYFKSLLDQNQSQEKTP